MNLTTECMGMKLKNPIIVASSGLTNSAEAVLKCAEAGAGAVVLKSLFEELIQMETRAIEQTQVDSWHPEAFEYVSRMVKDLGPTHYVSLVKKAKEAVSIPVIASLNCISNDWWPDYATRIADAGADAIELNMAIMPTDIQRSTQDIEATYLGIVDEVKKRVSIPVAVKIGPYFTSLTRFASQLDDHGVAGLVLFNRFYQIDIDIERLQIKPGSRMSSPRELSVPLRWVSILAGKFDCDLVGATGIHEGVGVIKHLLAGAAAVQLCTTLYLNGLEKIGEILNDMSAWMNTKGFDSIDDFRGRLSQERSPVPETYERLQYIKAIVGIE